MRLNRKYVGFGLMGAAGLVAAIAACSTSNSTPTPVPVDASAGEIVFGMSASLTGGYSAVGNGLADGTKTAEALINGLGGVLGKQVSFIIKDDESDKGPILKRVVGDLVAQNVVALMGPGSSTQCDLTNSLCYGKIPQISAWSTSPVLTNIADGTSVGDSRWFFRTVPPDDLQAKVIYLAATSGPPRVVSLPDAGIPAPAAPPLHACEHPYILYNDDVIGVPGEAIIESTFLKEKTVNVYKKKIPTDPKTSYTAELDDMKSKVPLPDCLILWTYPDAGAQFLNDLHALRTSGPDPFPSDMFVIGADGVYDQSVLTKTVIGGNPSNANGLYGTAPDTAPERPDYDTFVTLYRNYKGDPTATPPAYAANAFDAAILIALAVQRAGKTDGTAVRDALYQLSGSGKIFHVQDLGSAFAAIKSGIEINYSGASGEVDFDDHGNIVADYIVWNVENGAFKTIRRVKSTELK